MAELSQFRRLYSSIAELSQSCILCSPIIGHWTGCANASIWFCLVVWEKRARWQQKEIFFWQVSHDGWKTGLFQLFFLSQSPIVSLLNQNKGKSLESAPHTTCVASREQKMTRMHWRLGCWQFCWATPPMSKWCWRLGGGGEVELKKLQKSELFNTELKKVHALVGGALRGLGLLHVVLEEHEAAELLEKWLDSVVSVPPGQHWNSPCIHLGNNYGTKIRTCTI